jgi:hypothetical protein
MMNDEPRAGRDARRRPRFRLDALTAVLVATVVLAAACGSSPSSGSALPTFQAMTTEALAYAKCVRAHGIPDFPDPTVQNSATRKSISFPGLPAASTSPRFKSVDTACRKQSGFEVGTPAALQALMANDLQAAECMRAHGITNFPDPVDNGRSIRVGPRPGSSGIDTHSARFQSAQTACRQFLPAGGP